MNNNRYKNKYRPKSVFWKTRLICVHGLINCVHTFKKWLFDFFHKYPLCSLITTPHKDQTKYS